MKVVLFLLATAPLFATDPPNLIYLVRHAEKVDTTDASGLNPKGLQRAEALADFFRFIALDAVYTSQYRRTQDTVAPLLQNRRIQATVIPSNQTETLTTALLSKPGRVQLVSGHSNTIPDIIQALGAQVPDIADDDYNNLYLVIHSGETVLVQRFRFTPGGDSP